MQLGTALRRTALCVSLFTCIAMVSSVAFAQPCYLPDASGTVVLPDPNCPYLSPDEFHEVVNGLPAGTTIEITGIHKDFICNRQGVPEPQENCNNPGGALGGEVETYDSIIQLQMVGTGDLAGFNRTIEFPVSCITETGPRGTGDVQTFDTEMVQLQGQIFGDPDFDFLTIQAGRNFGLPSPGQTILTKQPDTTFNVDSFFDIVYTIDFQGAPGSILEGFGGSTQGTVRMQSGQAAAQIIPTTSTWGMLALALLLISAGVVALRRRAARVA